MKYVRMGCIFWIGLTLLLYLVFPQEDKPDIPTIDEIPFPPKDSNQRIIAYDWYNNRYIQEGDLDSLVKVGNKWINKKDLPAPVKTKRMSAKDRLPISPDEIEQIYIDQ